MTGFTAGLRTLLTVGIVVACGKDPATRELIAPDANPDADPGASQVAVQGNTIAMLDDCDDHDPAWNPTGGCRLRGGRVTAAEFDRENLSPLSLSVVGHQAWRNSPSYLKIGPGTSVRVTNAGGRIHTFTEVAAFGGGRVPIPILSQGLVRAPECLAAVDVAPGGEIVVSGLTPGNHRFMCCIHSWMRAIIKVSPHPIPGHG